MQSNSFVLASVVLAKRERNKRKNNRNEGANNPFFFLLGNSGFFFPLQVLPLHVSLFYFCYYYPFLKSSLNYIVLYFSFLYSPQRKQTTKKTLDLYSFDSSLRDQFVLLVVLSFFFTFSSFFILFVRLSNIKSRLFNSFFFMLELSKRLFF